MGTVPLSVLFAVALVQLVEVISRASHSRRSSRLSHHLLLLPQSLLPRLFSRSARLRRWRTLHSQKLSRRNVVPVHPAKCSSLLPPSRDYFSLLPLVRRRQSLLLRRQIRYRPRHTHHARQRLPPHSLHFFLPLASSHRRRKARLLLLRHVRRSAPLRMELS